MEKGIADMPLVAAIVILVLFIVVFSLLVMHTPMFGTLYGWFYYY